MYHTLPGMPCNTGFLNLCLATQHLREGYKFSSEITLMSTTTSTEICKHGLYAL